MCQDKGRRGANSTVNPSESIYLPEIIDFQMIILKYMTPAILRRLPDDLIMFHVTIESG